jgi:hypothetical protein
MPMASQLPDAERRATQCSPDERHDRASGHEKIAKIAV